jgi:hypothetical protein
MKRKKDQSSGHSGKDWAEQSHAPSKKGVKREARHEHAVHELGNARQDEKGEKSIDKF